MSTDNDEAIARALAESHGDAQEHQQVPSVPPERDFDVTQDEALARALAEEHSHDTVTSTQQNDPILAQDEALARAMMEEEERMRPIIVQGRPLASALPTNTTPPPTRNAAPFPPAPFPFSSPNPRRPHMCVAPGIIGRSESDPTSGACVEMMIDTGAQTSVISLSLAKKLSLDNQIDSRMQGIAAGVGRARIVGHIRNVPIELHNVEFPMEFAVLDCPDQILLVGLDLLRRYKCIVDLERDVLIFGGHGGVEVPLLPAEEQHLVVPNPMGCSVM